MNEDINYINLIGLHSLSSDDRKYIMNVMSSSDKKLRVIINAACGFIPENMDTNIEYRIIIDLSCLAYKKIEEYLNKISDRINIKIFFLLSEPDQYKIIERIIKRSPWLNYLRLPFFDGTNYDYYKDLVTLQNDIYIANRTVKKITLNKLLNTNYWGKLYITSSGEVSSTYDSGVLGNILSNSIKEIVYKELTNENSIWLHIRNNDKCGKCVFQYICPPISMDKLSVKGPICPETINRNIQFL